jgi:hypothetical protein
MRDMYADYIQTAAADAVQGAWAEARSRAINEGRPYRFAIVQGQGNYRIAPDSPEFWSGGGGMEMNDPENPALDLSDVLPRGIRFPREEGLGADVASLSGDTSLPPDSISPDMWKAIVTFMPDGTAAADAEVILESRSTDPLRLRMRGLTTTTTTERLRADGTPR